MYACTCMLNTLKMYLLCHEPLLSYYCIQHSCEMELVGGVKQKTPKEGEQCQEKEEKEEEKDDRLTETFI